MRRDQERLLDMIEALRHIERYAKSGRHRFDADELVRTWIVHHLVILGEAVRALSEEFRNRHADIPWEKIIGTRNRIVHGYFDVDPDLVWAIVERELPALRKRLERALEKTD